MRRLLKILAVVAAVVAAGALVFALRTRNPSVSAFYDPPADLPTAAGTILRSAPFTAGIPTGARAWRVLYASTDPAGKPVAVSGLVIAPKRPPEGPRPVLAWAHGTTGIARPCAPSLSAHPLEGIPDMTAVLRAGWVITLTDYPGLGTPGPHPYLVGASEARSVLDSVRAAHRLDIGVPLQKRYAIWGHSQGGHAALFAGQLASSYLPEYGLVGVAALAPGTDLEQNLAAVRATTVGNVLTVMAVESWREVYDDIPDGTLVGAARAPAQRLVRNCINQPSRLRLLLNGATLPKDVLAIDPATSPAWRAHLRANSPTPTGIAAPVFVAQGDADDVISPTVTANWVTARCKAGAPTSWHSYRTLDHVEIVGQGGVDAFAWTTKRFADAPLGKNTCPTPGG